MHLRAPAAALLVLTLTACAQTESPDPQASQETATLAAETLAEAPVPFQLTTEQEEGKVVYETMCWSCHGSAGRGDGPAVSAGAVAAPPDLAEVLLQPGAVRRLQARFQAAAGSLDAGDPHMVNVLNVVDVDAFSSALGYLEALTYPADLEGSAIAGHQKYLLRCQTCHGTSGRGDGPGAEVLELAPADFTRDTLVASRNFVALFDKIRGGGGGVHGSSMPAWGVMFQDGDVWDLVAYISTFQPGVLSAPPAGGE